MMENNLKLDPGSYFRMPFILGPLWKGGNPQFFYSQTEVIVLQYLTDNEAINSLLPSCFKNGKEP
jgi:hypothetical protein